MMAVNIILVDLVLTTLLWMRTLAHSELINDIYQGYRAIGEW